MTLKEILLFIAANQPLLKNHFHVKRMGVFGSFARGDFHRHSDIDLLVDFEDNLDNQCSLKQELRDLFHKEFHKSIDIANEKYLKPYIREEILKEVRYADER